MENKPHDLEDKGLTGILERWAEGTGDPKFQEYINQIGGCNCLALMNNC